MLTAGKLRRRRRRHRLSVQRLEGGLPLYLRDWLVCVCVCVTDTQGPGCRLLWLAGVTLAVTAVRAAVTGKHFPRSQRRSASTAGVESPPTFTAVLVLPPVNTDFPTGNFSQTLNAVALS